jgi:hypothetical protein
MKRIVLFVALTLAAAASGCAAAAPPVQSPESGALVCYLTRYGETFELTTNGLLSPNVQISRTAGGFVGRDRSRTIEMRVANREVVGAYGSEPIHLTIEDDADGTQVGGMFGRRIIAFRLERAGQLGPWTATPAAPAPDADEPAPAAPAGPEAAPGHFPFDATIATEPIVTLPAALGRDEAIALLAVVITSPWRNPVVLRGRRPTVRTPQVHIPGPGTPAWKR